MNITTDDRDIFVVDVVLNLPLAANYSYLSTVSLERGRRVLVPLRTKERIGFVAFCCHSAQFTRFPFSRLKYILRVDLQFILPAQHWELTQFISTYYHYPFSRTLFSILPKLLITKWVQQINNNHIVKRYTSNISNINDSVIPYSLNNEQQAIVDKFTLHLQHFHVGMLHGITGSGKTEVFLQLIKQVLSNGKQVLVLVPEINLTPQLYARFSNRFMNARIQVLTSHISDQVRLQSWYAAAAGSVDIVLGTRSSLFTPFAQLGLIVVDEEHDVSLKQQEKLRYHARDVAIWQAKALNIPIMLSSATPALETVYNYEKGKFCYYQLTKRAVPTAILPQIHLIDLRQNRIIAAGLTQIAITQLEYCVANKQLAMVFINKRGYAPVLACKDCTWIGKCHNCTANLVYHRSTMELKCHYCGYCAVSPTSCPSCNNHNLQPIGHGTQKLESWLTQHFPTAAICRIDRDTTSNYDSWQQLYYALGRHEIDILIGTQLLAKGHDFSDLGTIICLNSDSALFSHDFRASEHLFTLLTQLAGRSGRSSQTSTVLVQTNYPTHPLYSYLKQNQHQECIKYMLHERAILQLPPFSYQAAIKLSATIESKLMQAMQELSIIAQQTKLKFIANMMDELSPDLTIYETVPAVMYKIAKRFRAQLLITTTQRTILHDYLKCLNEELVSIDYVKISFDIDPIEF